jgi:hypothetical protein
MTVVDRENLAPAPGVSLSPLAARLELLLRRAITVDQFEADMVSCCEAHPDEVWNLLAMLDQYHRLERLPTELYRALKAAADRYGLVRREPYIPYVSTKVKSTPEQQAEPEAPTTMENDDTEAAPEDTSPALAARDPEPVASAAAVPPSAPSAPPSIPPAAPDAPSAEQRTPTPEIPKVPEPASSDTPFRHLLQDDDDEPAMTAPPPSIRPAGPTNIPPPSIPPSWKGERYSPPARPSRRSKLRAWLLPTLLLAVLLGAAAWLKQGQGSVNMLAGPEDAAQQAANSAAVATPSPDPVAAAAPPPAPVPAPTFESEPPLPPGPPPSPTAATAATPKASAAPSRTEPAARLAGTPTPPMVAPTGPIASPTAPIAAPTAPIASPTAPIAAPTAPIARPTAPVAAPTAPIAKPTAPIAAPTAPIATPTAPIAAPTAPIAAPVARAPAPAAVRTPAGPSTIEFSADNYTVRPGDSAARIMVRRSGEMNGDLNFVWWTENSTAVADVDYVAWGRRTETIPSGRNSVTLLVPIINDSTRTAPRRFQVVIGSPDNGARLGATTHATVQLSGSS